MHCIPILDNNKYDDRCERNKIITFGISCLMSIVGFSYMRLVFDIKGGRVLLVDFDQLRVGVISLSLNMIYCILL